MTKDEAYADLRRRILTLSLAPSAELDEVRLAEQYGMSRTPLREVLRRLAGEGCVELRSNRSAIVAPMGIRTLRSFFQTAPMVYASITRLAAEARGAGRVEELKLVQARFRAALKQEDVSGLVSRNEEFHHLIGSMACNPYLMPSLRRLLVDHARIGETFWRPADAEMRENVLKAADQHDRMIAAIEAGNATEAVTVTLEHWSLSRGHIEDYVSADALPLDPSAEGH